MRREELLSAALAPGSWSVNANCLDEPVELIVDWFDGKNWDDAAVHLDAKG